ncbi:hypothetical protein SOPP22_17750 [Shewanella sp. OPT22]|nr:hypothetical protein SOPP22_17750 [Shewanella sp. OPT22]
MRDTKLILIEDTFPEIMVGAPCPMIFADENVVYLSYYDVEDDVALIKFDHCFEFRMGMPGEDEISKSPYCGLGLLNFETHYVKNSPWLNELESKYKVISDFSRNDRKYIHYVFTFHDRTFECISSGYSVEKYTGISVKQLLINAATSSA